MIAGAFALVALAAVAAAAGSDLDAVQTAHAVFGVVLAAGYIALDGLVFVGYGHFISPPFWCNDNSMTENGVKNTLVRLQ